MIILYDWHKVASPSFDELIAGQLTEVALGDKTIGLLKKEDAVYAFAAKCPHASGRLCDGWLDAQGRIVCPDHKYRFDPVNGRNTSGEGYKLKTYPVEIREGYIYVGL